jgi:predicted RNase H-like HicB family nuclease
MKYAVVVERGPTGFGASVPDLPGCIAVAATREEVERLIEAAMAVHLAELRDEGLTLPAPATRVLTVDIA